MSLFSGSAYFFIKVAVEDLPAITVAFMRCFLGACILLPLAWRSGSLRGLKPYRGPLAAFAVLEFAAPFALIAVGTDLIASSLTGVLMATGPAMIVLIALVVAPAERAGAREIAGLLVGFVGVAALLGIEVVGNPSQLIGALLVLLGCISFACGALLVNVKLTKVPSQAAVSVGLAGGALLLAFGAAFAGDGNEVGVGAIAAVGVLGTVHGAVNYVLFFELTRRTDARSATVTAYVAPLISVLLGVLILDEPVQVGLAAGLPLIVLGSFLATRSRATGTVLPPELIARRRRT